MLKAWHSEKDRFRNPWPSYIERMTFLNILRLLSFFRKWKEPFPDSSLMPQVMPIDWDLYKKIGDDGRRVPIMWLGHASFLLNMKGVTILTDPVFSERCSPFTWLGPKRFTAAPCKPESLPVINVVLLSHNHYDHMDVNTLRKIESQPIIFVALGNQHILRKAGLCNTVIEMDWWQEMLMIVENKENDPLTRHLQNIAGCQTFETPTSIITLISLPLEDSSKAIDLISINFNSATSTVFKIICTPAQHQSARGPFDRNVSLWCSWTIQLLEKKKLRNSFTHLSLENIFYPAFCYYFAGDTGYRTIPQGDPSQEMIDELTRCPAFKEIGEKYGPVDVSCLPIGAYDPRWIMSCMHCSPEDAVCIHQDLRSKFSIGMHWGTFKLTLESVNEPPVKLKKELQRLKIREDSFITTNIGEIVERPFCQEKADH